MLKIKMTKKEKVKIINLEPSLKRMRLVTWLSMLLMRDIDIFLSNNWQFTFKLTIERIIFICGSSIWQRQKPSSDHYIYKHLSYALKHNIKTSEKNTEFVKSQEHINFWKLWPGYKTKFTKQFKKQVIKEDQDKVKNVAQVQRSTNIANQGTWHHQKPFNVIWLILHLYLMVIF